jgi:predicted Zn-dependent protease
MERKLKPGDNDFAKTHPLPRDRIAEIQINNQAFTPKSTPKIRQERFLRAVNGI